MDTCQTGRVVPEGIFLTDGTTLPAVYGLRSGKNRRGFLQGSTFIRTFALF